jgi:hypothetical protein
MIPNSWLHLRVEGTQYALPSALRERDHMGARCKICRLGVLEQRHAAWSGGPF